MKDMINHAEMIWNELQEAKIEIKRQREVIDMLKEAQVNSQIGNNLSGSPMERISSGDYRKHLSQAVLEGKRLYASTKEGTTEYHGLQSIAQSNITIAILLEDITTFLIDQEN